MGFLIEAILQKNNNNCQLDNFYPHKINTEPNIYDDEDDNDDEDGSTFIELLNIEQVYQ